MKKGGNIKSYKRQYKSKTKRINLTLTNDEYGSCKNTKITTYIKRIALAGLHYQTVIPKNILQHQLSKQLYS
jgi:predicted DNA binding CopG/RHH family protein